MTIFTAACVQLCASRSVDANTDEAEHWIREAAAAGADYVQTPEQTALMELDPGILFSTIVAEENDQTLMRLSAVARDLSIWLHIGSLALRAGEGRAANRAFVIRPDGQIAARYDKTHMFDVDLPSGERYRESKTYRAGDRAVVVDLPWLRLGLSICYDLRFPEHYRALVLSGARMISAPAAFTKVTGEAHWHILQRARAIECGAFMISAAQGGHHENGRDTYGHSMIINPWGEIIAEADDQPGIIVADIDPAQADIARRRIPVLNHIRDVGPATMTAAQEEHEPT